MDDSTFITRVRLKNYKSIAECDVKLGPLQFLVGPNGSGKSNFLDAMRFVADSLEGTLSDAISSRGGINEVLHRTLGQPVASGIDLSFRTRDGLSGNYRIGIGGRALGHAFGAHREQLNFTDAAGETHFYTVESGRVVESSIPNPPTAALDRLYLVHVSGWPPFRPVYESFSHMEFYNLDPDRIRELQPPTATEALVRDGRNLAGILLRLQEHSVGTLERIEDYLKGILPGIIRINAGSVKPYEGSVEALEYVQFWQQTNPPNPVTNFLARNMSDGTLRALGILVALFQFAGGTGVSGSLVGIEEPEAALHPAAAGILRDALREASGNVQVIVTSHSPDLLDDSSIPESQILAVSARNGATEIGPLDAVGRSVLHDRLYTPGELLRMDQLQPEQVEAGPEPTEKSV